MYVEQARKQEKLAKIRKEMQNYNAFGKNDIEDAINLVEAILEIEIADCEKYEKYATRSIDEMRTARNRVSSLYYSIGDIDEL